MVDITTSNQLGGLLEITQFYLTNSGESEATDFYINYMNPFKDYHERVYVELVLPT